MCPGQHSQGMGRDLTCRRSWRWEPEVPVACACPVPLLPPSGLPPCSGRPQSRVLGWLWYQEAFRSWLRCWQPCSLAHPSYLTALFITCTGPRSQRYPTQNTLNGETGSKALCGKIGKKKVFNCTPFSKTRNKLPLRMLAILGRI